VQSSRRLERKAGRNVEVMWLLGRLAPDHKTIADFRKDNGLALRSVCARFVTSRQRCRHKTFAPVCDTISFSCAEEGLNCRNRECDKNHANETRR